MSSGVRKNRYQNMVSSEILLRIMSGTSSKKKYTSLIETKLARTTAR